jgi:hypothetical protein
LRGDAAEIFMQVQASLALLVDEWQMVAAAHMQYSQLLGKL